MVERHHVAHRADPHVAGARAGADRVQAGRRYPALVRAEVVLDAKAIVKAERVARFQLTPQLLVALVRGHPRLAPNMRKMGELHGATTSAPGANATMELGFARAYVGFQRGRRPPWTTRPDRKSTRLNSSHIT